jgi:hypothetical protein
MSFAAGLVAGQRAAQGAIDAFTQTRGRRNERRFNEDMAALEAERQGRMQGLGPQASPVEGRVDPLTNQPIPVQSPAPQQGVGLVDTPTAAPANPMSTSEYFQRQAALAGKHNLTDRAERYMAQGLQAQQFEEQQAQYQRDAELRDAKFGLLQDQFKETQTQWDERLKLLQDQQTTYKTRIDKLNAEIDARMTENERLRLKEDIGVAAKAAYDRSFLDDDSNITDLLQNIPEKWAKDDVTKALYQNTILDTYMTNTGSTIEQFSSVIGDVRDQVSSFMDGSKYKPGEHINVVNEQLRFIIPDQDNNTKTSPIVEEYTDDNGDQKFMVRDGDVVYMDGMNAIEEIGAAYIEKLEENPWVEAINIKEAKQNQLAQRVRALETEEQKREAITLMLKANPHMFATQKELDKFLGKLGFDVGLSTDGWTAASRSRIRGLGGGEQATPGVVPSLDAIEAEIQAEAQAAQEEAVRQEGINTRLSTITPEAVKRADRKLLQLIIDSPTAPEESKRAARARMESRYPRMRSL